MQTRHPGGPEQSTSFARRPAAKRSSLAKAAARHVGQHGRPDPPAHAGVLPSGAELNPGLGLDPKASLNYNPSRRPAYFSLYSVGPAQLKGGRPGTAGPSRLKPGQALDLVQSNRGRSLQKPAVGPRSKGTGTVMNFFVLRGKRVAVLVPGSRVAGRRRPDHPAGDGGTSP